MKRYGVLSFFLAFLLVLSSCSREISADELATELRSDYASAPSVRLTAKVNADYGVRVYDFTLRYERSADSAAVTILEPESIAGITARIAEDGVTLMFDGAEIFTGALTENGLSPVSVLPVMVKAWGEGLVTTSRFEGNKLFVEHYITDAVSLVTVFDRETLIPLSAELISEGCTVLTAEFDDVVM